MDFGLSEQQHMLRDSARDFLQKECPKSLVRETEHKGLGVSTELWRKMAQLGWLGLIYPEESGGSAGNFQDLCILLEEMGRFLVPGPFVPTVVCSGFPILFYGTEKQKKDFLPNISKGNVILAPAFIKPNVPFVDTEVEEETVPKDGGYLLSGTRLFVACGRDLDWFLYKTKTNKGESLFLISTKSSGVSCRVLDTIALDGQCEFLLNKVVAADTTTIGEPGQGEEIAEKIDEWGALAQSAYILGSLEAVLEMTIEYAKNRVQFDKPIGTFQAIQHQCADMALDIDSVKYLVYEAAWKVSEKLPATKEISMAKARASDASRRVCLLGHKIHGGVGLTLDHDMQIYFRKSKASEIAFGDATFHRNLLGQQLCN